MRSRCYVRRDEAGKIVYRDELVAELVIGVAPECTLLSYKVLDNTGNGDVSTLIAAIQKIRN